MTTYSPPLDHMHTILAPMLDSLAKLPGYEEVDGELVDQVLEEAGKFASGALAPLNSIGDQQGSVLENGVVRTPEGFKDAYGQFVEGGMERPTVPRGMGRTGPALDRLDRGLRDVAQRQYGVQSLPAPDPGRHRVALEIRHG